MKEICSTAGVVLTVFLVLGFTFALAGSSDTSQAEKQSLSSPSSFLDTIPDKIFTGENPGDYFGDYNFTGDVNGDGYDDLLVAGASRYNDKRGRAYLYYGGPGGLDEVADLVLTGKSPGDYFGEVGPIGDVNGDNYADVIVGAPGYNNEQGRVYIYYGGSHMDENADLILNGETTKSRFGRSIAVGDVNNDGYEDVFVAAVYYNNRRGRVYLYYGGNPMDAIADKIFDGENQGDVFGRCIYHQNKIADVNGDNYGDVLISTRHWNKTQGRAYLYYGGPGTTMDTICDKIFTGDKKGNHNLGGDSLTCGYVNGDKYPDIIIAGYNYDSFRGRAHLYYGGTNADMDEIPDEIFTGEEPNSAPMSVVFGDFSNDGYDDLVIGGWLYNNKQGRVWLYYNKPGHSSGYEQR
jgi:hypothetical protein